MNTIQDMAWAFISERYDCDREHFEFVWDLVSNADAGTERPTTSGRGAAWLGAGGDDEVPELLPVLIFVDAAGKISTETSAEEILSLVQTAARERKAERELFQEMTAHVKALTAALGMTDRVARAIGFARVHKSGGPIGGWMVDEAGFNELLEARTNTRVFVVDRGEFLEDSCGEVLFDGKAVDLAPQTYRLLVHALRNDGTLGSAGELDRACWFREGRGSVESQYQLNDDRKRIGAGVARLSRVLQDADIAKAASFGGGRYRVHPIPDYCLIDVQKAHSA